MDIFGADLQLEGLAFFGTSNQFSSGRDTAADFSCRDLGKIFDVTGNNDLNWALTATIV